VLVVSTSGRAEDEIAFQAYLAAERHGGNPLPVLLTTSALVRTPLCMLGPVWRAPTLATGRNARRGKWLPALPLRVAGGICNGSLAPGRGSNELADGVAAQPGGSLLGPRAKPLVDRTGSGQR
jgi:hypothetical protein